MNPVIIIAIVVSIAIGVGFAVFLIPSLQSQSLDDVTQEEQEEAGWQMLQKTYLEQECREKYIGQTEELQDCYDRIDEEQRLNPPTNPKDTTMEEKSTIPEKVISEPKMNIPKVQNDCDPSYPDFCIPLSSPDLDCGEISYSNFVVIGSDPHGFDRDNDGIGCEK